MSDPHQRTGRPRRQEAKSALNVTFRCTAEEGEALDWHANEQGETRAWIIRDALAKAGYLRIPTE